MNSDELLTLLGKVTANGQALEYVACLVLGRCLGLGDEALAIRLGQRLPMAGRLDLARESADARPGAVDPDKVKAWVSLAREASNKRNTIIHSAWLGNPATDKFEGALTKKGTHESGWGRQELQGAIARLREAVEEGKALLGGQGQP